MRWFIVVLSLLWGVSAQAAETVKLRAAPHPGYARIVFDWKTPSRYEASLTGRSLTVRFARPFRARLDIITDRLPDQVASARLESDGRTVIVGLKGDYVLRPRADGGIVILDLLEHKLSSGAKSTARTAPAAKSAPAPKSVKDEKLDAAVARALKPVRILPQTATAEKRDSKPAAAPFVSVDVVKGRDVSALRFNWRENVGAAVFRRRGQVWVVFDSPSRIELGSLRVNGAPVISAAEQVPVAGGSAVRLTVDPSRHMRARREGTVWVVEILGATPALGSGIEVVADPDAGGGRLLMSVEGGGHVLQLRDPEVGDWIDVVTTTASGLGVAIPRRFIDVEVLESAQGVAVRPIADRVTVDAAAGQIIVAKPGGLRVSRYADRSRTTVAEEAAQRPLFDFADWAKGPAATFELSRKELFRRAAATGNPETRRKAQLGLAHFYLGNGFGPEALGVIHEIARTESGKEEDVTLRAMRGVARVLSGEYALANDDLRYPVLDAKREIAPWRGVIAAARGDWKSAQQQFRELETVWEAYPTWLAARMGLLAAEASLAIGDTGAASARIDALDRRDLAPADRAALAVLRGYLRKASGDVDGAIAIWRGVAGSPDRKAQARARYALANAMYERKEATIAETIDTMEQLRYAWRGDVHEFDLLRRLSQLYTEHGDSRKALQTLKEAATYFHDIEGVDTVAKDMAKTFHHLFAEGGADKLDPVTALALFDEFRELTPSGEEGKAMVRKFAERLASVDLLDDAARLLENQVKFSLAGEEKARVGLRLATLRLAERKPQAALDALAESAAPNLPADVAHDRLMVRARALAANGKGRDALVVLSVDNSVAAERIRATVKWRSKDWKAAAESFARLLKDARVPSSDVPGFVLSRAVALTLEGDDKGVIALYKKYADTMKTSPYAKAFVAVAGPDAGAHGATDFREAARVAGEITSIEALLGTKPKTNTASAGS